MEAGCQTLGLVGPACPLAVSSGPSDVNCEGPLPSLNPPKGLPPNSTPLSLRCHHVNVGGTQTFSPSQGAFRLPGEFLPGDTTSSTATGAVCSRVYPRTRSRHQEAGNNQHVPPAGLEDGAGAQAQA